MAVEAIKAVLGVLKPEERPLIQEAIDRSLGERISEEPKFWEVIFNV